MQKINKDNFKAGINRSVDGLLSASTKEELDRALAGINRDLQSYANIQKEIIEFNELYNYFIEGVETN